MLALEDMCSGRYTGFRSTARVGQAVASGMACLCGLQGAVAQSWWEVGPMDLSAVWSPALKAECVLNRPGSPGGGEKAPPPTPGPRGHPAVSEPEHCTTLCILGWHLVGPLLPLGMHGGLNTV